jgi:cell division septation protein DedD
MKDRVTNDDSNESIVDAPPVATAPEEGTGQTQRNLTRTKPKSAPAKRKTFNEKEPTLNVSSPKLKPKWNAFPTFKKFFSRRG